MYALKKFIGLAAQPGTIVALLLGWGFGRLLFSRGKRGLGWVGLGALLFYAFSTAPLPNYLSRPLESRYEPVMVRPSLPEPRYIVVLSAGLRLTEATPPTSRLDEGSALRVAEGIRLFQLLDHQPTLIMTGHGPRGDLGGRMAAFARSMGVPPEKVISANEARDTYGNALEVRPLVKNEPFFLVTSAVHLPRALGIFQKLGLKPVPAPADFRSGRDYLPTDFFPNGNNLTAMEGVVHEYLGLAYLSLFPDRAGE
uniref:DUF218 domain-containing protein n=1 Tax=Desulfobacca acetoxidans TaxID=60893 RepID=A0A7C3V9M6_9BACT